MKQQHKLTVSKELKPQGGQKKPQAPINQVPSGPKAPIVPGQVSKLWGCCKKFSCLIFVLIILLNLLLTAIFLIGFQYHQADEVLVYEIFESSKFQQTNKFLQTQQYAVLYGSPQSGLINFIQHQAHARSNQGNPVIYRDLQQDMIKEYTIEAKHFLQIYLGNRGRGKHCWFILIDQNGLIPQNQIQRIQKAYPHDSIVLVSHKELQISKFKNHKFPVLKAKDVKQFMQKDLKMDKKQVKQILSLSAGGKDPTSLFKAYKDYQQQKAKAAEEARRLKEQEQKKRQQEQDRKRLQQEEKRLKQKQEARQIAAESEGKRSKKSKAIKKGKSAKLTDNQALPEKVNVQKQVTPDQQQPSDKKSKKPKGKGKNQYKSQPQQQQSIVESQPQQKKSKKSAKKGKKDVEEKVEQQLKVVIQKAVADQREQKDDKFNKKSKKNKKNGKAQKVQEQAQDIVEAVAQQQVPKSKKDKKNRNNKQQKSIQQQKTPQAELIQQPAQSQKKSSKKGKKKGNKKSKQLEVMPLQTLQQSSNDSDNVANTQQGNQSSVQNSSQTESKNKSQ